MKEKWYLALTRNHARLRAFFFFTVSSLFMLSQFQNCAVPNGFEVRQALEQEKSSLEMVLKPQTSWKLTEIVHQNKKVDLPQAYSSSLEFEEVVNEELLCAGSCPSVYRIVLQQPCQKAEGQYIVSFNMESGAMEHNIYTQVTQNLDSCRLKDWDQYVYSYFAAPKVRIEKVSATRLNIFAGSGSYLVYEKN